ncbi:uncharacterized protein RJT20DRAFT_1237 [Scheffersomyces xylosifermentans]|uniref:uncharacterized protein n=1 Tax=Scheffersomyces xylosifermentans TaxID=1304137 RepID=UPI00315C91F0
MQCQGITSRGQRCKLDSLNGFCHFHENQRALQPQPKSKPPPNPPRNPKQPITIIKTTTPKSPQAPTPLGLKPAQKNPTLPIAHYEAGHTAQSKAGFIYIYTMTRLLNPKGRNEKSWLKVKNLPDAKNKDDWQTFNSAKSHYMLLKIGMTTQTVDRRLKQWQSKCHHELTCVYPNFSGGPKTVDRVGSSPFAPTLDETPASQPSPSGILKLFKKLSLNNSEDASPSVTRFKSFRSNGFYCSHNLDLSEQEIHRTLHRKYGKGDVYCTGCASKEAKKAAKRKNGDPPFKKDYNIHVEWFLVPKDDLEYVYRLIDSTCQKYSKYL